jgi:hypothetical protein
MRQKNGEGRIPSVRKNLEMECRRHPAAQRFLDSALSGRAACLLHSCGDHVGLSRRQRLDPELATLLGSVRVAPNGEGLEVSFAVSSDQMVSLIKRNTFSATATFGGLVRGMCGRAK